MCFNNRGGASFFKILLRDSIDRLPLPPAYARKYMETSNIKKQMVVLKIKSGVRWSVTYSKIRDKYYFMDGWLKFMKDNRLQMGVFLVFWRLSASPTPVFQVSVYGPNGCLKQPTVSHVALVSNRKTPFVNEDVCDDESSENVQQKMISVVKRSYLWKMPLKKSFVEATGIRGYCSLQLRNDGGKIWDVKLNNFKYGLNQFMQISTGWYDFRKHNKIKIGHTCEFYYVKSDLLHVRVLTAKRGNMRQVKSIEWMSKG